MCKRKTTKKINYRSAPELLYSIEIFSKKKCTVWGVVGHKHQCAFFCVFFDKVLGRKGLIATSHTPEQSQNAETCTESSRSEASIPGGRVQIWSFSFLWRGLKTQYSHAHYFSQKVGLAGYGEGTHQNQVAIYLETYFIRKNKEKLSFIYRYII